MKNEAPVWQACTLQFRTLAKAVCPLVARSPLRPINPTDVINAVGRNCATGRTCGKSERGKLSNSWCRSCCSTPVGRRCLAPSENGILKFVLVVSLRLNKTGVDPCTLKWPSFAQDQTCIHSRPRRVPRHWRQCADRFWQSTIAVARVR